MSSLLWVRIAADHDGCYWAGNPLRDAVPAGTLIHAILGNYAAHKHPKVRAWLAGTPAGVSFHTHLLLLGQCGRDLLCHAHPPAIVARRLSLARRPAGRNQPLARRAQPQTKTLRLDGRSRPHRREDQSRVPSVGVKQLSLRRWAQ